MIYWSVTLCKCINSPLSMIILAFFLCSLSHNLLFKCLFNFFPFIGILHTGQFILFFIMFGYSEAISIIKSSVSLFFISAFISFRFILYNLYILFFNRKFRPFSIFTYF